jgi:diguanylate cyclase (GGDEF)-like protein
LIKSLTPMLQRRFGPARRRRPRRRFPGEDAWRWYLQLRVERTLSPLRTLIVVATAAAWFTMPVPADAEASAAIALIALSGVYALADLALVYRLPRLASRVPYGSTVLDWLLIAACIRVTGGAHSPFDGLAFLGAVSAPVRLQRRAAFAAPVVYGLSLLALAGPSRWYESGCVFLCGIAVSIWMTYAMRDQSESLRDALTGCFSREYATFRLNDLFENRSFPLAIAAIDFDDFKRVNDSYGHAAGDVVLVQAVRVISDAIRQGDLLARSGGDEFVLILPNANTAAAFAIAQRVRGGIERTSFRLRHDAPRIHMTASIGLAVTEDGSVRRDALVQRADEQLYAAKEAGRNQVVL